ncbi:MAG TPA: GntR family transcriptional regulator [Steroidobacteraceae bacterium]|jgi:DNA-binding GntR family transcriptional regulator|nr:GntR family transcriptional regulator [Steroidobacteraceae bacterium]
MIRKSKTAVRRPPALRPATRGKRTGTALTLRRAGSGTVDTTQVYERIWGAIMDHSLPPETRLVEGELCAIFGLGRTRMRQVLQRLAHERVVTLMRNRGAKVTRPTVEEAREVFAARRVIEAGIVEAFIAAATRRDIRGLQEHLTREEQAWRANNRQAMLKLSGEFHLLVAEAAGNHILTELLRDLVSRSSLIIAVYQSPNTRPCPPDAHRELAALLERGDRAAVKFMIQHLDHVMADLRLEDRSDSGIDLRSVFARAEGLSP